MKYIYNMKQEFKYYAQENPSEGGARRLILVILPSHPSKGSGTHSTTGSASPHGYPAIRNVSAVISSLAEVTEVTASLVSPSIGNMESDKSFYREKENKMSRLPVF